VHQRPIAQADEVLVSIALSSARASSASTGVLPLRILGLAVHTITGSSLPRPGHGLS
jgi:hypothetical protein